MRKLRLRPRAYYQGPGGALAYWLLGGVVLREKLAGSECASLL